MLHKDLIYNYPKIRETDLQLPRKHHTPRHFILAIFIPPRPCRLAQKDTKTFTPRTILFAILMAIETRFHQSDLTRLLDPKRAYLFLLFLGLLLVPLVAKGGQNRIKRPDLSSRPAGRSHAPKSSRLPST